MATGAANPGDSHPDANQASREIAETAQYIERQIDKTRTHVRLHDIAAGVLLLTAGTIAFLLAVILIDHWVAPLGFWGRSVALLVLILGWGYGCWRQVKPPLLQRINPVYAARAIEDGVPGLKNSLINFLLLRSKPGTTRSVVLDAVQDRAASDLTDVSVETVVDRSRVIRIGYLITGLVVLGGLYNLASPKDPWQTVNRVLAPWSDIARPARVTISDVRVNGVASEGSEPFTVYLGEKAVVTAKKTVRGPRREEQVLLYYTTFDQQTVDEPVTAQPVDDLGNYRCSLPAHDGGLQQDVTFRIEAGDAVSKEFLITVLAAPLIDVDSILYEFPPYTKREKQIVERQGDIRGLEGTRVSVQASANQEIKSAYIHFHREQNGLANENERQDLPMHVEGKKASASFHLTLARQRPSKQTGSYEIRFTNQQGQKNQRPVRHLIEVTADLEPHIDILTPVKFEIELPEDGKQTIEVLARDPDFGLTLLRIRMVSGGESLLDETLFDDPAGWLGASNRKFVFEPREFGLRAGQTVTYWAVAEDNRADALTGSPKPNRSRTSEYVIKIIAPENPDRGPTRSADETTSPQPTSDSSDQEEDGGQEGDSKRAGIEDHASSANAQPGSESASDEGTGEADNSDGASESQRPDASTSGEHTSSDESGGKGSEGPKEQGAQQGDAGSRESSVNDGSDDGEIFDRVLERMRRAQEENSHDRTGKPAPDGVDPAQQQGKSGSEENHEELATGDVDDSSASRSFLDGKQGDGEHVKPSPREGKNAEQNPPTEGQSADSPQQDDSDQQTQPGLGDNGQPGAGKNGTDDQPNPEPQGTNRPRNKSTESPEGHQDPEPSPARSPSTSSHQSDSEGDDSGDRSGGGESGGGQNAPQPGQGSPGSNTPADEGSGAAREEGEGANSERAGDDVASSGKTGKSGQSAGPGSRSAEGDAGSDDGQDRSTSTNGSGSGSGQALPSDARKEGRDPSSPGQQADGMPATGGLPGDATGSRPGEAVGGQSGGDDPNLEYTREATDMALRYLKDQQDNPDRALLDELGWTNDDLRNFIQRWDKLHEQAGTDQTADRELKERLESLGLQPSKNAIHRGKKRNDDFRNLIDPGSRTRPPQNYLELYEAYQKSTAEEAESE